MLIQYQINSLVLVRQITPVGATFKKKCGSDSQFTVGILTQYHFTGRNSGHSQVTMIMSDHNSQTKILVFHNSHIRKRAIHSSQIRYISPLPNGYQSLRHIF